MKKNIQKYDNYKDSGIEWIGEIKNKGMKELRNEKLSSEVKLKYCIALQKGKLPKSLTNENPKGEFPVYLSMDFFRGNPETIKYVEEKKDGVLANEGDVLILWDGSNAGEILLSKKGVISSTLALVKPKKEINNNFLFYLLKSNELFIKDMSVGMGIPHVNPQELLNSAFFIPSFNLQSAIATYLDRKTAEIDELIADKKRLIELYEEEKIAVINDLVTGKKVWNGSAWTAPTEVKDSGIEWIGEIPEGWEVSRMKNICKVRQGLQIPIEKRSFSRVKNSLEYITIRSINNPDQSKEYIEEPPKNVICCTDDILMARTGATGEPIINVEGVFHNNFFLVDYDKSRVEKMFLFYFLKSRKIKEYLLLVAGTTTIPDLNHGAFYSTPFFEFSIDKQNLIVRHIETETARINAKKEKAEKLIELLTEYREALISEVVTGKVKVF